MEGFHASLIIIIIIINMVFIYTLTVMVGEQTTHALSLFFAWPACDWPVPNKNGISTKGPSSRKENKNKY